MVGCETQTTAPANSTNSTIRITPPAANLSSTTSVTTAFTATGGSGGYMWNLSNASLGTLGTNGAIATYENAMIAGTTVLTVMDSSGSSASASITQQ